MPIAHFVSQEQIGLHSKLVIGWATLCWKQIEIRKRKQQTGLQSSLKWTNWV